MVLQPSERKGILLILLNLSLSFFFHQSDEKFETLDHIEAERRLEHSTHGEYLVRKSPEQEKYALAVKWNDGIVHCLIHTVPDVSSFISSIYDLASTMV